MNCRLQLDWEIMAVEFLTAIKTVHFIMQNIVAEKNVEHCRG